MVLRRPSPKCPLAHQNHGPNDTSDPTKASLGPNDYEATQTSSLAHIRRRPPTPTHKHTRATTQMSNDHKLANELKVFMQAAGCMRWANRPGAAPTI